MMLLAKQGIESLSVNTLRGYFNRNGPGIGSAGLPPFPVYYCLQRNASSWLEIRTLCIRYGDERRLRDLLKGNTKYFRRLLFVVEMHRCPGGS